MRYAARAIWLPAYLVCSVALAEDKPEEAPHGYEAAHGTLITKDSGVIEVGEGCWLDEKLCVVVTKDLVSLREENARLDLEVKKGAAGVPVWVPIVSALAALIAGGSLGIMLGAHVHL